VKLDRVLGAAEATGYLLVGLASYFEIMGMT
jgi:hypothetical protein